MSEEIEQYRKLIRNIYRNILFDSLAILVICILSFWTFSQFDSFEIIYQWIIDHEELEADEVIPLIFVLSLCMAYFSSRRWYESHKLIILLRNTSTQDALTKLYNRRKLDISLKREYQLARNQRSAFSIMILDIDHFKLINDNLGHQSGDDTLIEVASLLKSICRESDILGRWGGEEFLLLCPGSNGPDTLEFAERLRHAIEHHSFSISQDITISIGICDSTCTNDIESMLKKADGALYQAKKLGRNKVYLA